MAGHQCVEYGQADAGRLRGGQGALFTYDVVEGRRAGHVLHHHPRKAVLLDDVVHGGHMRVIAQPGGQACLTPCPGHARDQLRLGQIPRYGDFLDGDLAGEVQVVGEPDPPLPPAPIP